MITQYQHEHLINFDFYERFPHKNSDILKPCQTYAEMQMLCDWIGEPTDPVWYLEIGSYAGESLYYLTQKFPRGSNVVLVDTGEMWFAREYLLRQAIPYVQTLGITVHAIIGDSQNPKVVKSANNLLKLNNVEKFDYCLIDGNHDFSGVYADYNNYGHLAKWLIFHDISEWTREKNIKKHNGMDKASSYHFWQGLKQNKSREPKEFIANVPPTISDISTLFPTQQPKGFGVIRGS